MYMETKPFYTSKEVWIGVIAILNIVFNLIGLPSIEPTPEFYGALIGLIVAVRVFVTQSKLSLK